MNNELDEEVILTTPEETSDSNHEETDESSEDEFDWKAEALKQKQIAENQRIRAEKAEKRDKPEVSKVAPTKQSDLTVADIIAISNAKIEENEDIEKVTKWAKFNQISISEAIKSSEMKAYLSGKDELRKTAQATSTGTSRRGSASITDGQLLANAEKGIMPESDADYDRLAELRLKRNR